MPAEIVWSRLALARLQEIRAFVALDKPDAAQRLATRIVSVVDALKHHPHLGRTGAEPGIRELVIGGTPYIVLYRVQRKPARRGGRVLIATIWRAAQREQSFLTSNFQSLISISPALAASTLRRSAAL